MEVLPKKLKDLGHLWLCYMRKKTWDTCKDGSRYWGVFAHFSTTLLGLNGLIEGKYSSFLPFRKHFVFPHESPLHPSNSKDRSQYWQKSAHLDGQIPWNSMTHPWDFRKQGWNAFYQWWFVKYPALNAPLIILNSSFTCVWPFQYSLTLSILLNTPVHMHGRLICLAFCPSVCPMSLDQSSRLENNLYLKK